MIVRELTGSHSTKSRYYGRNTTRTASIEAEASLTKLMHREGLPPGPLYTVNCNHNALSFRIAQ